MNKNVSVTYREGGDQSPEAVAKSGKYMYGKGTPGVGLEAHCPLTCRASTGDKQPAAPPQALTPKNLYGHRHVPQGTKSARIKNHWIRFCL